MILEEYLLRIRNWNWSWQRVFAWCTGTRYYDYLPCCRELLWYLSRAWIKQCTSEMHERWGGTSLCA